jgi:plastocyanin
MTEPANSPSSSPRRRHLVAAALLAAVVAVVALGACGGGTKPEKAAGSATQAGAGAPAGGGPAVQIVNFEFQPQKLTVKAGTTVTWTNEDTAIHAIKDTSPLATPVSSDMAQGDTFSITYDRPGSYSYICGIHNYMTGSVEVTG